MYDVYRYMTPFDQNIGKSVNGLRWKLLFSRTEQTKNSKFELEKKLSKAGNFKKSTMRNAEHSSSPKMIFGLNICDQFSSNVDNVINSSSHLRNNWFWSTNCYAHWTNKTCIKIKQLNHCWWRMLETKYGNLGKFYGLHPAKNEKKNQRLNFSLCRIIYVESFTD